MNYVTNNTAAPEAILAEVSNNQEFAAAHSIADIADGAPDAPAAENGFINFGLAEPIQRALAGQGYTTPTPIQEGSIPALLQGRDMLGIAQTGTGKTAAFALPILHHIALNPQKLVSKHVRALILAPTRELVVQIAENIRHYGKHIKLRSCAVFGGVSELHQIKALQSGVDVLIATPGRLLDLANRRHVKLDQVQTFVLDEADRMLDMGFIRDVNKITAMLPEQRQSLLFSATMPKEIAHLAEKLLNDPVRVEVTPKVITVERIDQKVFFVDAPRKRELLLNLLDDPALSRVVVFTRTKHAANRVSEHLEKAGVSSDAIHGNKSQNARQHALNNFKSGKARVLVATDIAARGIHVSDISHVINYELPNQPESYVHRIGRTARAGADGIAFSFCDRLEKGFLKDIERFTKKQIPVAEHAFGGPAAAGAVSDSRDGRRGPRAPRSFADGNRDKDFEKEQRHGGGRGGRKFGDRKFGDRKHNRFENRSSEAAETFAAELAQPEQNFEAPREQRAERHTEHRAERHEHRGGKRGGHGGGRHHGGGRNEHRGERHENRGDRHENRGERKDFKPQGEQRFQGERKLDGERKFQGDRKFRDRHEARDFNRGEGKFANRGPRLDRDEHRQQGGNEHPGENQTRAQADRSHAERHFGNQKHEQRQREVRDQAAETRGEFRGPKRHGKPHGGKPHAGKPHGKPHKHGGGQNGPRRDAGGERPMRRQRNG